MQYANNILKQTVLVVVTFLMTFIAYAQEEIESEQPSKTQEEILPPPAAKVDSNLIFSFVERMPEFPGGKDSLMRFLGDNISYPEEAKENCIKGMVYVKFVVDELGKAKAPQVLKSPHNLLSDEAIRVIEVMPNWSPGIQKGQPVKVFYTLPINFNVLCDKKDLEEVEKRNKKRSRKKRN